MLEETYERSYNHNYMIIRAKEKEYTGFDEKIVQENEIPGLLPCQFRVIEGNLFFYYEISGKRTLYQLFQKKKIDTKEMRRLFMALSVMQRESQRYLLDFQKYMLLPEYLYSDFDIKHLQAVYYPDYKGETTLAELGNFFIEHVDYQEAEAVELAYSFQQRIMEENVNLESVMEVLLKEKEKAAATEISFGKVEREDNVFIEKKEVEEFQKATNSSPKNGILCKPEALYKSEGKLSKWRLKDLSCVQEIYGFIKGLAFFKERGKDKKQKKELPVYEMELDLDEGGKEAPFFSEAMPSEATQFFSCQESQEVHALIYQGRKNMPDFELEVFPYIIGKGERGIDGRLESPAVSRIHSQLDYINDTCFIMDLNSTNGTFLNGERLPPNMKKSLSVGDRIQFADEKYIFQ